MTSTSTPHAPLPWHWALLQRVVKVRPDEARVVVVSFVALFCIFTGYASLRPVLNSLGVTIGTRQLGGLFGWTFAGMLAAMPIFGWLASRFARRVFLPAVYGFFIANLLGFYWLLTHAPSLILGAKLFFVWVSVVNLFIISAFWSLMADLHTSEQSRRLFGFIAAGSSAGSIVGPALTALLVKKLGNADLLLLAAGFWTVAVALVIMLLRGARPEPAAPDHTPSSVLPAPAPEERPLGGNPLSGISLVVRSPYLLGISLFILLLSATTTFLYLQQAAHLAKEITNSADRTRLLATLDTAVNILSLLLQLLVVGRLTVRLGVALVLFSVPALMVVGFVVLSLAPALGVLIAVMIVRRVGEYGLLRPSREILFTSVDRQAKYKAKSFIDTVVYRGADWLNAKLHDLLVALGLSTSGVALGGAVVAAVWAVVGFTIGRWHTLSSGRTDSP
ncbi:MAG TPA: MFS transporter [Pseudomonadota bacterium]|nr:MFS transporter [Pseudomonadota bacterium]